MESSLSALDGDIAASRASLSALQAEEKAKLTKLEGVAMAYSTMVQNIDVYNEQCSVLSGEAAALVAKEDQRRMDTQGITSRVKQEVLQSAQMYCARASTFTMEWHTDAQVSSIVTSRPFLSPCAVVRGPGSSAKASVGPDF